MADPADQIAEAVTALGPKRFEQDGARYEGRDFDEYVAYARFLEQRSATTRRNVPFRSGKIVPDGAP